MNVSANQHDSTDSIRRRAERAEPEEAAELELVLRIRGGDDGAWEPLLMSYQDRLFGLCLRMLGNREEATDLTQDALVRTMQGLMSYDGRAKLSTWMHRVTMNVVISHLRKQKHRRHASLDAMRAARARSGDGRGGFEPQGTEPEPEVGVQEDEQHTRYARALLEISDEHRAILLLRDARGMDYGQIADVLGVAGGTVKSRLFRARAALRDALGGDFPDPPSSPGHAEEPTNPHA